MFFLSGELFEKKTDENENRSTDLLGADRIAEDQHGAENGEKLARRREDRTGQWAEPFDR